MTGQNIFAEVNDSAVALPNMGGNTASPSPATEGATVDSKGLAGLRNIVYLINMYVRCLHDKDYLIRVTVVPSWSTWTEKTDPKSVFSIELRYLMYDTFASSRDKQMLSPGLRTMIFPRMLCFCSVLFLLLFMLNGCLQFLCKINNK